MIIKLVIYLGQIPQELSMMLKSQAEEKVEVWRVDSALGLVEDLMWIGMLYGK